MNTGKSILSSCLAATALACFGFVIGPACTNEGNPCGTGALVDGECVPRDCDDKRCPDGFICLDDVCTDAACLDVTCDAGTVCAAGGCYPTDCEWRNCPGLGEVCTDEECTQASCVAVECPADQLCADGICYPQDCHTHDCPGYGMICIHEECVDRSCAGVECPAQQACANGYCYPSDCEEIGCFGESEVCIDGLCLRRSCVDVECETGTVCADGFCYPADCADVNCLPGEVCREGICLDADCVDVVCPQGESCARGECFDTSCGPSACDPGDICYENQCQHPACVGVVCPAGQNCAQGLCFADDCQHSQCGSEEICIADECVSDACAHVECAADEVCGNDGSCYPQHCDGQSCTAHQLCVDGACVDRLCVGIACPDGERCAAGHCYPKDCEQACASYQVCVEGECTDAECAGCRCCPSQSCTLNNQCQVVGCCGDSFTCLYDQAQGLPGWESSGMFCNDQNSCTEDDRCLQGRCAGTQVECLDPPPDTCDGNQRTFYPSQGICTAGGCEYPAYNETCENNCLDGRCVGETCGNLVCDSGEQCISGLCACGGSGPDCSNQQACCGTACVYLASDSNNCGMCENVCGNNASCHGAMCYCSFPWGNCNGDWNDGCETDVSSSMSHCGQCGQPCSAGVHAQAVCVSANCSYTCDTGFDDCDAEPSTCEADVSGDDNNCGVCNRACNSNARCVGQQCQCDSGWGDCNGSLFDGCETWLSDSAQHCGACQAPCLDDAISTAQCINSVCIRSCNDPMLDCDDDSGTCETDVRSDADHCGGCDQPCSGAGHSTYDCQDRNCVIAGCEDGWCDLDGQSGNGCEEPLDTEPQCAAYVSLGAVSGDEGSDIITENAFGEHIYRIHVQETYDNMISCRDLRASARLQMPAGTDYDLHIYCDACSGVADSSENSGSTVEEVYVRWEEDCIWPGVPDGSSEDRYVYVEVIFRSGSNCTDYTLTIEGNSGDAATNCDTP